MQICRECQDWPLLPTDNFCGSCGAFVAEVTVRIDQKPTPDGSVPWIHLESTRPQAKEIPFSVVLVDANSEREVARMYGDSFPDGLIVTSDPEHDQGVQVFALRGLGKGPRASNSLADAIAYAAGPRVHSVHLADHVIDFASATPRPGGWLSIPVEFRNGGAPALVALARLRVDGEPTAEEQLPLDEDAPRRLFPTGAVQRFEAWITEDEFAAIENDARPRTGTIDVAIFDQEGPRFVTVAERARLFKARPAAIGVELSRIRCRAGQRARIGARLSNRGGTRVQVESVEVLIDDEVLETGFPLEWRQPLDPGDQINAELRPLVGDRAGMRTATVRVTARADNADNLLIEEVVRAAEVTPADLSFDGAVCIDFGTSESGAAALIEDEQGRRRAIVIDLLCVPIELDPMDQTPDDRSGRFLPTQVARMTDGSFRTGPEATTLIRAAELERQGQPWPRDLERPTEVAREFKWELSQSEADGGARGQQLATAYLGTIKELIENHPLIAARIDGARIYATRPTIFDNGRAERLVQAYRDAGLGDPRIMLPSKEEVLIAESWSPLPFVLHGGHGVLSDEENQARMLPLDLGAYFELIPPPNDTRRQRRSAWLVVCDVGDGSADFSVVEILPEAGKGRQLIRERDSDTDDGFVGRAFRKMVVEAIVEWSVEQWRRRGNLVTDTKRFAETLGATESSPPIAQGKFKAALEALQFEPGLFSGPAFQRDVLLIMKEVLASGEPRIGGNLSDLVSTAVRDAFSEQGSSRRAARRYLPIELPAPSGGVIVIDNDTVGGLIERLLLKFLQTYPHPLKRRIDALIERGGLKAYLEADSANKSPADLVRIARSGRGAAFPLASVLIRECTNMLAAKGATFGALPPIGSKSITSWGGLQLGEVLGDTMSLFTIDLGGKPLRPRARIGREMTGDFLYFDFDAVEGGAAASLADIALRHADLEAQDTLVIETGHGRGAAIVEVKLPRGAAKDPEGWWLCGMRHGANARFGLFRGATSAEAMDLMRSEKG